MSLLNMSFATFFSCFFYASCWLLSCSPFLTNLLSSHQRVHFYFIDSTRAPGRLYCDDTSTSQHLTLLHLQSTASQSEVACNLLIVNHIFLTPDPNPPLLHSPWFLLRLESYFSRANAIYELCMLNNIWQIMYWTHMKWFFFHNSPSLFSLWMDEISQALILLKLPAKKKVNCVYDAEERRRRMKEIYDLMIHTFMLL